jgi:prophage regulatory protein
MAATPTKPHRKPRNKITYVPINLPTEGFVRLPTVLSVFGVSKNTYLDGAKAGKYPHGRLLSPRCRVFPVAEIREALARLGA